MKLNIYAYTNETRAVRACRNKSSRGLDTRPPWISQTQLFGDHIEQDVKQFKMRLYIPHSAIHRTDCDCNLFVSH